MTGPLGHLERYPALGETFSKTKDTNEPSIENRVADVLWSWKFAVSNQRDSVITESKLPNLLEYWFPFSDIPETRRLGLWCDGISHLIVKQLNRISFSISGVGWFPFQLAAFETEWHFKNRRDRNPRSIILRLDYVAHEKQQSSKINHIDRTSNSRPKIKNSDWMVAVELTET